jgi:hypothetical protein
VKESKLPLPSPLSSFITADVTHPLPTVTVTRLILPQKYSGSLSSNPKRFSYDDALILKGLRKRSGGSDYNSTSASASQSIKKQNMDTSTTDLRPKTADSSHNLNDEGLSSQSNSTSNTEEDSAVELPLCKLNLTRPIRVSGFEDVMFEQENLEMKIDDLNNMRDFIRLIAIKVYSPLIFTKSTYNLSEYVGRGFI